MEKDIEERKEENENKYLKTDLDIAYRFSAEIHREVGKFIKGLGLKGVSHQVQGDQLRVSGKKRDDLQSAIAAMRDHDFGIPLQFTNFRD